MVMELNGWWVLAALLVALVVLSAGRALLKAVLTFPAIAWVPIVSRRMSNWVKSRDYSESEFLMADGAGEHWAARRQAGLDRLASVLQTQFAQ